MKVKLKVKLNQAKVRQLDEIGKTALGETGEQLRADLYNEQVMPRDTGALQNEGTYVDRSKINECIVSIVHNTPYARRLYFNPQFNFRKDKNPNAQGKWWELWRTGAKRDFCKQTYGLVYRQMLSRKR